MTVNSKWIKELGIRPNTLQMPHENIGETLQHIGTGNDFLNKITIAQEIILRINKWDNIKFKKMHSQGNKSLMREPIL